MTVRETNDPEINFDPSSSVPQATAPPVPTDDVPIASAVPIISATAVADTPGYSPSSQLADGSNMERTTNSDGSLTVKVTTTTTQSDGYRSVRVEEYSIPANMAGTVTQTIEMTGEAPSSLYLTKIQEQRLPPQGGHSAVAESSTAFPTTAMASGQGGGAPATIVPVVVDNEEEQRKQRNACVAIICIIAGVAILASSMSNSESHNYAPSPSWSSPSFNPPSPSWPTYPSWSDDDWKPSFPSYSWTLAPAWAPLFEPTKSPAPSGTPYPTYQGYNFFTTPPAWDRYSYPPYWIKSVDSEGNGDGTEENLNGVDNDRESSDEEKKDTIRIAPKIVSPTFIRDPTAAPIPALSHTSMKKKQSDEVVLVARV